MKDEERMLAGKLFSPVFDNSKIRQACKNFNESEFWHDRTALQALQKLMGKTDKYWAVTPPFYCDRGYNISCGQGFYANTGLVILDDAPVTIGDFVMIGPQVGIYAVGHPITGEGRLSGLEYGKPVKIGNHVWIGGHAVINPGVTIGDDVVIGSGSVVVKDIPSHTVAVGNPCRPIRKITDQDRQNWAKQVADFEQDPDTSAPKFNE